MVRTLDEAPFVDIFSVEFQDDAASVLDPLRSESWIVRTPIGALVISREHVHQLLSDRRMRSAVDRIVAMQGVDDGSLAERIGTSILAREGEDHARLRRLVSRAFTPRAADAHRPRMREVLAELVEPHLDASRCELVGDIADHYPIRVMCHVLGVPESDHEQFVAWGRAMTWALSFNLSGHREEVEWGLQHLDAYVSDLIPERRANPREDLVTALVQAREADDTLTDDEIQMLVAALIFAGFDTTRNQLGLAMALFADHPGQWEALGADPSLAPRAVEEVMRFRGAVGAAPRWVPEDFEYDGYLLPAGTLVSLGTSAANHDPSAYEDPGKFDITVEREPHFTFGGGPHYCLGASLARAELQEALAMLAPLMPGLALDGEPEYRPPLGIFGPEHLPIRWDTD